MEQEKLKKEFIKKFCNDHNHKLRFLRGLFEDDEDLIETVNDWWISKMVEREKELYEQMEGLNRNSLKDNDFGTMQDEGWYVDHDIMSNHSPEDGSCLTCPVQVQCEKCEGNGLFEPVMKELAEDCGCKDTFEEVCYHKKVGNIVDVPKPEMTDEIKNAMQCSQPPIKENWDKKQLSSCCGEKAYEKIIDINLELTELICIKCGKYFVTKNEKTENILSEKLDELNAQLITTLPKHDIDLIKSFIKDLLHKSVEEERNRIIKLLEALKIKPSPDDLKETRIFMEGRNSVLNALINQLSSK